MVDAFLTSRRLVSTPAIQELQPGEGAATARLQKKEIVQFLKGNFSPSFSHVSCTAPMMPKKLGGVVDLSLRVYGVKRLRVIDASIVPRIPSTRIQASVYAVAKKAADIIKSTKVWL
jgi:choline dehydrogenase-like flavoprotein